MKPKAQDLLALIAEDPYRQPPPFEKLVGDLAGFPGIVHPFLRSLLWSDQVIASESLASLCEEIEGLVANYRRRLQLLSELKQSLLQNACSGERTADKEVSNAFGNKEEVT